VARQAPPTRQRGFCNARGRRGALRPVALAALNEGLMAGVSRGGIDSHHPLLLGMFHRVFWLRCADREFRSNIHYCPHQFALRSSDVQRVTGPSSPIRKGLQEVWYATCCAHPKPRGLSPHRAHSPAWSMASLAASTSIRASAGNNS